MYSLVVCRRGGIGIGFPFPRASLAFWLFYVVGLYLYCVTCELGRGSWLSGVLVVEVLDITIIPAEVFRWFPGGPV